MMLAGARHAVFKFAFHPIIADVSRGPCLSVMNRTDYRVANCPPLPSESKNALNQISEFHDSFLCPIIKFLELSSSQRYPKT
jgi:hypothetical protein